MATQVGTAGAIQQVPPTAGSGGQGVSYPLSFTAQGRLKLSSGTTSIEESLRAILETAPGERAMLPGYGARQGEFEPVTLDILILKFKKDVFDYEPRVSSVECSAENGPGTGEVTLTVAYVIAGEDSARTLTYPLFIGPA